MSDELKEARNQPRGIMARIAGMFSAERIAAPLPAGMRVYAVGDIHGCAAELDRLTAAIVLDRAGWQGECHLVYIGDYIDRGPDSRGVVDRLLNPPAGFHVCHLRGNHDQTMLDFLSDPGVFRSWREFGARETLLSYGVSPPRFEDQAAFEKARDLLRVALPASHLAFFEGLPLSAKIGGYYFAHAGVRPGIALDSQKAEDLLWVRDEFLTSSMDFGMVVVHGHTPAQEPVRQKNRIGIDTGAYATGRLTAVVLEGGECRFLSS